MRLLLLILAVICLQVFVTACKAQTGLAGPAKTAVPAETLKNPGLWLNEEPMGYIDDPSKLGAALSGIIEKRIEQGAFREAPKSDPQLLAVPRLIDGVYLVAAPDVSLGDLVTLYKLIDEKCTVQIPKQALIEGLPGKARPNPYFLAVSIGKEKSDTIAMRHLPDSDSENKYSYDLTMNTSSEPLDIWGDRIVGSIEISADGQFIVNERDVRPNAPALYPPKQRPLRSSLKEEVKGLAKEVSGKNHLFVLAHRSASFKDLERVLKLADELNLRFQITVNMEE